MSINNSPVIENKKATEIEKTEYFCLKKEVKVKEVKFTGGNLEKSINIKDRAE